MKVHSTNLAFHMWDELTIVWNDLTILWNDLTIDWNDLTWNDLTMERNDRIPISVFQPPFFANEAYIPEQLIVRVLISLPTNETFATFLVSAIVDDDYSYSCMYRYFSRHSMKMRHTTFLSSVLSWY